MRNQVTHKRSIRFIPGTTAEIPIYSISEPPSSGMNTVWVVECMQPGYETERIGIAAELDIALELLGNELSTRNEPGFLLENVIIQEEPVHS